MKAHQLFRPMTGRRPYVLGVQIFILLMLVANPAQCEEYRDFSDRMVSLLKYSAGFFSALMIHEGAHYLAAEATGTDISWEVGNYNQPLTFTEEASNDTDGFIVNASGLVSQ